MSLAVYSDLLEKKANNALFAISMLSFSALIFFLPFVAGFLFWAEPNKSLLIFCVGRYLVHDAGWVWMACRAEVVLVELIAISLWVGWTATNDELNRWRIWLLELEGTKWQFSWMALRPGIPPSWACRNNTSKFVLVAGWLLCHWCMDAAIEWRWINDDCVVEATDAAWSKRATDDDGVRSEHSALGDGLMANDDMSSWPQSAKYGCWRPRHVTASVMVRCNWNYCDEIRALHRDKTKFENSIVQDINAQSTNNKLLYYRKKRFQFQSQKP